jgi:hypothetical protein
VSARENLALPQLVDCATLARELGCKRPTAEAIMRRLPQVRPEGVRKTFVKRADVAAYLEASTERRHLAY